ncbi:hypothetical protein [Ferruginibacter sp.]
MKRLQTITFFIVATLYVQWASAQHTQLPVQDTAAQLFKTTEFIKTDSGLIIKNYYKDACKGYMVKTSFIPLLVIAHTERIETAVKEPAKPKGIVVHGNVSYDFFYRSKIDTPFSQQNLQQHTERVWLDVLIKDKYPFKVGFTARQSNSPFFKDLYSMNLNFDRYGFAKNIKQELLNKLITKKWENPYLKLIDTTLKKQLEQYQALKNWLNGPEALQKMIEAKERIFYRNDVNNSIAGAGKLPHAPSFDKTKFFNEKLPGFKIDSLVTLQPATDLPTVDTSFLKLYDEKKAEMIKLEKSNLWFKATIG